MVRPFGIAVFVLGVAVMISGWWLIYRSRAGFVEAHAIEKDCAAGNALLIVGGMATLFGIHLVTRPIRP